MREKLASDDNAFRKTYIYAIVDRVEVDDDQVRIIGRKEVLEQAVRATVAAGPGVRSFVPKWRTRQDSNSRPQIRGLEPSISLLSVSRHTERVEKQIVAVASPRNHRCRTHYQSCSRLEPNAATCGFEPAAAWSRATEGLPP